MTKKELRYYLNKLINKKSNLLIIVSETFPESRSIFFTKYGVIPNKEDWSKSVFNVKNNKIQIMTYQSLIKNIKKGKLKEIKDYILR